MNTHEKGLAGARLLLAGLVLLVLGAACSGGDPDGAGRLSVDGRAEVEAPGGKAEEERGSRTVMFGERVTVLDGTATLRLDRDRDLELRAGSSVVLQEATEGERRVAQPLLLERDLLVQAPSGARLTVSVEGADVVVSGGAQISRGPVLVVSSYNGAVELRSGDQSATVPALRQLSIPIGGPVPARPSPLSYDGDDAWDRRFLSEAIEFGNELEARSTGFSAQVKPGEAGTVDFLIRLLPTLSTQPGFSSTLFDATRSPGESLVGAAIALEGTRGTFVERWAGVFTFRDDGAQWGLVALDQGVSRVPLLATVDAAVGRGSPPFDTTPSGGGIALPDPGGIPGQGPAGGGGTRPGGTTPGGGTPTSSPNRSVPTTVPPPTIPNPNAGPLNTGIPVLDDTINALVETLTGLLSSLGES